MRTVAKVDHVVSIKSNCQVREDAMTKMLSLLVYNVSHMDTNSVMTMQTAFNNAIAGVKATFKEEDHICCCMHDHDLDCMWHKYKSVHGREKACRLHKPLESCECRRENFGEEHHEHKSKCFHVHRFVAELDNMRSAA